MKPKALLFQVLPLAPMIHTLVTESVVSLVLTAITFVASYMFTKRMLLELDEVDKLKEAVSALKSKVDAINVSKRF